MFLFQVLILAAVLMVCREAAGGLPLAPYAYARPLAIARPALAPYAVAPAIAKVAAVEDYDPNPQYSYAYDIQDALTGKLNICFSIYKPGTTVMVPLP